MPARSKVSKKPGSLEEFKTCPPALLLLGPDRIRKSRALEHFAHKFFGEHWQDKLQPIESDNLAQMTDQLQSLSLFSKEQLFFVDDVQDLSEKKQRELLSLIELVGPGNCLLMGASKLAASNPIHKQLAAKKMVLELSALEGSELRRWTEGELKAVGLKRYSSFVVESLINLAHSDPDQINKLAVQIALFAEGDEVHDSDLRALFTQQLEPSEFELINSLLGKNRAAPEILLQQLLSSGKNAFALLGLIARVFSNYLRIKLLLVSGENHKKIAESIGQSAWAFSRSIQAVQYYSLKQLRKAQLAIVRADARLKNRSLGPDLVLSELIEELVPR